MNLTPAQEQAIFHKDGPALVLAGPGSGKTFVITQRIKALTETYHIEPGRILVISFTRAAAAEMKERFLKLTGQTQTVFGTFHSIFFTILQNSYSYSPDCIISDTEKSQLLRRIAASFIPENEDREEFMELFFREMQNESSENQFSREEYGNIYNSYVNQLKQEKRLDFDQILYRCHSLLANHPTILQYWQTRFSYVLIDEFQDINSIQFQTIKLLAAPSNNLFVVGDDDQAIYGFRGSKPDIMLKFPQHYPGCKEILLDKNFRCGQNIVTHSLQLISNNKTRFCKKISPFRNESGAIYTKKFETQKEECNFILQSVKEGIANGLNYKDFAILFRIHSGTKNLINTLHRANIPFILKDKIPCIFDHWISKDILSCLKLAAKKGSRQDFIRLLGRTFTDIYRSDLKTENWNPQNLKENFFIADSKRESVFTELFRNMDFLSALSPGLAVSFIQKALGYERFLQRHAILYGISAEDLLAVLEKFKVAASEAATFEELLERIEAEKEAASRKVPEDFNGISLMSFHSSKGLEFKRVYLLDCNEEITPYKKAVSESEIEEERRMFYVAMTRAKDELFLCYLERLYNKKLLISRFLTESAENGTNPLDFT